MRPRALVTRKLLPEAHEFLDRHLDVEIGAVGRNLAACLSGDVPPNPVSSPKII